MQKYAFSMDDTGSKVFATDVGGFYLASDVDARIAELERAIRFVIENDLVMRTGLGWRDSGCGCCSGPVDVPPEIDSTLRSCVVR
jgi:hypothetical protein